MNDIKYIGLDVHLASISIAVLNAAGKLVMDEAIEGFSVIRHTIPADEHNRFALGNV